eukprot:scaffold22136_cov22-Cyclotella_meneghiniana.AAC.1
MTTYFIEAAKSNRSKCKKCKEASLPPLRLLSSNLSVPTELWLYVDGGTTFQAIIASVASLSEPTGAAVGVLSEEKVNLFLRHRSARKYVCRVGGCGGGRGYCPMKPPPLAVVLLITQHGGSAADV